MAYLIGGALGGTILVWLLSMLIELVLPKRPGEEKKRVYKSIGIAVALAIVASTLIGGSFGLAPAYLIGGAIALAIRLYFLRRPKEPTKPHVEPTPQDDTPSEPTEPVDEETR